MHGAELSGGGTCPSPTPGEPVAPRRAGIARHRPSRFWRYIVELGGLACRSASGQIKTETKLSQHQQFEAHDVGCGGFILKLIEHRHKRIVYLGMRIAFGLSNAATTTRTN